MFRRPLGLLGSAPLPARRLPGRRHRRLVLESLEGRQLLAVTGFAVLGDNFSDEYVHEVYSFARSWPQILAQEQQLDLGEFNNWNPPRRLGYEYNWALTGADTATLISEGQLAGVVDQIDDGDVSHIVLAIGNNDFIHTRQIFSDIYHGLLTPAQIDAYVDSVVDNIHAALNGIEFAGADDDFRLVLANIPDWSVSPAAKALFPDPLNRGEVTKAIIDANAQIRGLASTFQIPLVDLFGVTRTLFGTNLVPIASTKIGNVTINNAGGTGAANFFVSDGQNVHTITSSVFANVFLEAFNTGHGENFDTLSEAEMLAAAGLSYGGLDTLNLPYENFITATRKTIFLSYGSGTPTNDFTARLNELAAAHGIPAFSAGEVAAIKAGVKSELETAYAGYRVDFVETFPTEFSFKDLQDILFGIDPDIVPSAPPPGVFGYNAGGLYVFPSNFVLNNLSTLTRADQVAMVGRATGFYATHYLGIEFGLTPQDAYGDPRITSDHYADTRDYQFRYYMSGDPALGYDTGVFATPQIFSFNPLEQVKLHAAPIISPNRILAQAETHQPHNDAATAQVLEFQDAPGVNIQVAHIRRAIQINPAEEWYRFTGLAGDLVSTSVRAESGGEVILELIAPDTMTVLYTSDDTLLGDNVFGPPGGTVLVDNDPSFINFVLPTDGDYFLRISADGAPPVDDTFVFVTLTHVESDWQNLVSVNDVNDDRVVNVLDLVAIITEIVNPMFHNPATGLLNPATNTNPPNFFDVNADNVVNVLDLIDLIGFIVNQSSGDGEGEGEGEGEAAAVEGDGDESLAADYAVVDWLASQSDRKRRE